MRKNVIATQFTQITESAETFNARHKGEKRFYPMSNFSGHRLTEIGLYDYKTKKYILNDTSAPNIHRTLAHMEDVIKEASEA